MNINIFGTETQMRRPFDVFFFDKIVAELENDYSLSFQEFIEISIGYKEITICMLMSFQDGPGSSEDSFCYTFDIVERTVETAVDTIRLRVDWDAMEQFYDFYANEADKFITAIKENDLKTVKAMNKKFPELRPSMNDSFYWLNMIGHEDSKMLEWAKSVDSEIEKHLNYRNPIERAITVESENNALWLIENYPNINLLGGYNKTSIIRGAYKKGMFKLVEKLQNVDYVIEALIENNDLDLLPEYLKNTFLV